MLKAVFMKQWWEVESRAWTYLIVALTLSLITGPVAFVFIFVGLVLMIDMAVQTAGEDVRWGTHEFIFTRAIDRKRYLSSKFLFGLMMWAAFMVLCVMIAWIQPQIYFWKLLSEHVQITVHELGLSKGILVLAGLNLFFLYSLSFLLCSTSRNETLFALFSVLGGIVTGVYYFVCAEGVRILLFPGSDHYGEHVDEIRFLLPMAALFLVPSGLFFLLSRLHYGRCELPSTIRRDSGADSWAIWIVGILIVVFIVFILLALMARVES